MRTFFVFVLCLCIFGFFLILAFWIRDSQRQKRIMKRLAMGYSMLDAQMAEGAKGLCDGMFAPYALKLQSMLDEVYEPKQTPASILKSQMFSLMLGALVSVLLMVMMGMLGLGIGLGLTFFLVYLPYNTLKNRVSKKRSTFDQLLPAFEMRMQLGILAGATTTNAMTMAIQVVSDELAQIELQTLVHDIHMNSSNPIKPYKQLAERVPTQACRHFTDLMVGGIQNGYSMSQVLEQAADEMAEDQLNRIREVKEKNGMKATAISSGMVFMPMIILFVAPLMANSL